MNISRPDTKPTDVSNAASSAGVKATGFSSKVPTGAEASPSDHVQLSSLSSFLASALEGSPAHTAKVSELGAAVSSGRYQVDAWAVSGSLIQHSIEFGASSYLGLNP